MIIKCSKCNQAKDFDQFYKRKSRSTEWRYRSGLGVQQPCRECHKTQMVERRLQSKMALMSKADMFAALARRYQEEENVNTVTETQGGTTKLDLRSAGAQGVPDSGQEPCTSSFELDSLRAQSGGEVSDQVQG